METTDGRKALPWKSAWIWVAIGGGGALIGGELEGDGEAQGEGLYNEIAGLGDELGRHGVGGGGDLDAGGDAVANVVGAVAHDGGEGVVLASAEVAGAQGGHEVGDVVVALLDFGP